MAVRSVGGSFAVAVLVVVVMTVIWLTISTNEAAPNNRRLQNGSLDNNSVVDGMDLKTSQNRAKANNTIKPKKELICKSRDVIDRILDFITGNNSMTLSLSEGVNCKMHPVYSARQRAAVVVVFFWIIFFVAFILECC